jgi:hypothetical protein
MDLNNLFLVHGCRTCLISFSQTGGAIQGNMWNWWSWMDWQSLLPSGRPFAWASVLNGAHQPLLCGMSVAPLKWPCAGTAHQSLPCGQCAGYGAIKYSAGFISAQLFTSEMSNLSEKSKVITCWKTQLDRFEPSKDRPYKCSSSKKQWGPI